MQLAPFILLDHLKRIACLGITPKEHRGAHATHHLKDAVEGEDAEDGEACPVL